MTIKDTNDPIQLKKYIRHVVEKYHTLASNYIDVQDTILTVTAANACLKLDIAELKDSNAKFVEEIKNLYRSMGKNDGRVEDTATNFLDTMTADMLSLKNRGELNNPQMNLFDATSESDALLIEFNEVDLHNPDVKKYGCVDKEIQTKQ